MKRCTCCGRLLAPLEWYALPFVGLWSAEETGDVALELRNCRCGSTLAVPAPVVREAHPFAGPVVL